jgi:hypothetical protein
MNPKPADKKFPQNTHAAHPPALVCWQVPPFLRAARTHTTHTHTHAHAHAQSLTRTRAHALLPCFQRSLQRQYHVITVEHNHHQYHAHYPSLIPHHQQRNANTPPPCSFLVTNNINNTSRCITVTRINIITTNINT